ncbi:hypothetical protein [Candidatus Mycoplasma haematohominis]|uniref:Uncharacterized protein n=1 Tax=Candidatus Mycoplasma haematohominis TaxID=1494318 RepID=A0A478FQE0_9MOLU|nr:hypothetical protein [Candidatus Mycoplasma haemohominis]GCE63124.1 hypothetical protein MHSWG343_01020 [Candidatus Mycoplasma haemohominis]
MSTANTAAEVLGHLSTGLSVIAAIILIGALLPPYFDVKRSKMTFGISDEFFLYFSFGAAFMWLNAFLGVIELIYSCSIKSGGSWNAGAGSTMGLFVTFLTVNCFSVYINTFVLKAKRTNMRLAKEKGMSEKDYWETYLKPGTTAK